MVSKSKVKKEFNVFAKKVARSEALGRRLDALDSSGFEKEFKIVRAKLKDLNALSQAEKDISGLEQRIRNKNRQGFQAAKNEKKEIIRESDTIKRKIDSLQKTIDEKRRVSVRKQLSRKEIDYVKDIPKLEKELKNLRILFETHTRRARVKVDTGVGVLVNSKFDDFISEIKGELTERLKEKEKFLGTQAKRALAEDKRKLHRDLLKRNKLFAERYRKLVKEFHDKYQRKLDSGLQKEIKGHFDVALKKRLEVEKRRIIDSLIKEDIARLDAERKTMKSSLHAQYKKKEKRLAEDVRKKKRIVAEISNDLKEKEKLLKKKEKDLIAKRAVEEAELKKLKRYHGAMLEKRKKEIDKARLKVARELERGKKSLDRARLKLKKAEAVDKRELREKLRLGRKNLEQAKLKLKKAEVVDKRELREKLRAEWKELEKIRLKLKKKELDDKERLREREAAQIRRKQMELAKIGKKEFELQREIERLKDLESSGHERIDRKIKELDRKREEDKKLLARERKILKKKNELLEEDIKKKEREKFVFDVLEMQKKMQKEYDMKVKRINLAMRSRVERELSDRKAEIERSIKAKYDEKLKKELWARKEELQKKKIEIENHIIAKTKELLG